MKDQLFWKPEITCPSAASVLERPLACYFVGTNMLIPKARLAQLYPKAHKLCVFTCVVHMMVMFNFIFVSH